MVATVVRPADAGLEWGKAEFSKEREVLKYPKPNQLSDPYCDWGGCEDRLNAIVAKPDEALTAEDYACIFQGHLPAGNYEECAYYLDKVWEFIGAGRCRKDDQIIDGVLIWLDRNRMRLDADDLWIEATDGLEKAVRALLNDFVLTNLSEQECEAAGIDFAYSIYPAHATTVDDLIDGMIAQCSLLPLLDRIITQLIDSENLAHVRWFIQIAFHTRIWCLLYPTRREPAVVARREALFQRLHRFELYSRKFQTCMSVERETYPAKYQKLVSLFGAR